MCMRKIYSFKCPVLLKPNIGWRHEFNRLGLFTIGLILLIAVFGFISPILTVCILVLYIIIRKIWQDSDHLFVLKNDKTKDKVKICIYQYENGKVKYRVRVEKNGDYFDGFIADEYEWVKMSDGKGIFIYSTKGVWYSFSDERKLLGERVGKITFIEKASGYYSIGYKINILNSDASTTVYYAKKAFYGKDKLRIPELDALDLEDRDYVLLKNGKEYRIISAAYQAFLDRGMVFIANERFKSAIFVEDGKTVVLVWDEKTSKMKAIYRKVNKVDSLKLFVETESKKNVMSKGVIYMFNVRTKSMRSLYQGQIVSIDKDTHHVYVANGSPFQF